MALDMERPSSVHSPDHSVSSSGNFGGVLPATLHHQLLRSSSPEEERGSSPASGDTSHRGTLHESRRDGGQQQGPLPAHPLTFSIEKILSPDFGRPTPRERRDSFISSGLPAVDPPKVGHSKETHSKENSRDGNKDLMWPAWVYCTRYSDRPSSGPRRIRSKQTGKCGTSSAGQECSEDDQSPRSRRIKKKEKKPDEKRPRTAFTAEQLTRLKQEFQENRYLTEKRRQDLARDLKLNESQIKIWFQNKRAKIKKASGQRNPLALQLMAQGLYNHSTVPLRDDEDDERPKSSSSS